MKPNIIDDAAKDFRYLLNRGYPRKAALDLVGNRYTLTFDQRHLLHRAVFAGTDAESRRRKLLRSRDLRGQDLAIDGHNVLITIEAGLCRRPLILADDGFIRDISGLSGDFKQTATTESALRLVLDVLRTMKLRNILFLFDAPISRSGELAEEVRARLIEAHLPGDALAVKVPERILIGFPGVVATSDTAIINQSEKVLDLAGHVLRTRIKPQSMIRWTRKRNTPGSQ